VLEVAKNEVSSFFKPNLAVLVFCSLLCDSLGQHHAEDTEDKNALHYLSRGIFTGQVRNFTMSTINKGELNDYYANAIGRSIHYESLPYKGFSVGLNGIFVYKTFSNDLLEIDTNVNAHSSYELQLFDVEHKGNYTDIDRLEELFLKYESKKLRLIYGKMEMKSPLINLHDGRMKPKVFPD